MSISNDFETLTRGFFFAVTIDESPLSARGIQPVLIRKEDTRDKKEIIAEHDQQLKESLDAGDLEKADKLTEFRDSVPVTVFCSRHYHTVYALLELEKYEQEKNRDDEGNKTRYIAGLCGLSLLFGDEVRKLIDILHNDLLFLQLKAEDNKELKKIGNKRFFSGRSFLITRDRQILCEGIKDEVFNKIIIDENIKLYDVLTSKKETKH